MSDYNHHTEVLDLVKALWGLKDAPRAFGMKLAETLRSCGFTQGVIDPQIWRKFKPGKASGTNSQLAPIIKQTDLSPEEKESTTTSATERKMDIGEEVLGKDVLCIITTHIDDIKGSGDKPTQDELLKACQRETTVDMSRLRLVSLNTQESDMCKTRRILASTLIRITT